MQKRSRVAMTSKAIDSEGLCKVQPRFAYVIAGSGFREGFREQGTVGGS